MSFPSCGDVSSHDNHCVDQALANPGGTSGPLHVFASAVLLGCPLVLVYELSVAASAPLTAQLNNCGRDPCPTGPRDLLSSSSQKTFVDH